MILQNQITRLPFVAEHLGLPVTGLINTDILNSNIQVIRSDGSTVLIPLVSVGSNKNFYEIDSLYSPGLYHIVIPATIPTILGAIQYSIVPAATKFDPVIYINEVGVDSSFIYQYLVGDEAIDSQGRLVIYKADGVTPLISYYLLDQNSQASLYNIRMKKRVV